jgi:hypothetical protein
MAPMTQELSSWRRQHPNQLFALGLAVVVFAASVWVGTKARAATSRMAQREMAWRGSADQLASLTQRFRVPGSSEAAALLTESGHLSALGVPSSDRVSLMEWVARAADASALSDVHVSFRSGVDSLFIPPRIIGGSPISPASYSVVVDCVGSFAGVVQFVSTLPPSVSVSRLSASQRGDRAVYHVLLSVYELANGDSAS